MSDLHETRYALSPRRSLAMPRPAAAADPTVPAGAEVLNLTVPGGRSVRYLRWRVLPQGRSMPAAQNYIVQAGDRLDLIATRVLGDPLQYWRIADANDAMNPFDLVAVPGRALRIPVPQSDFGAASEAAGYTVPGDTLAGVNFWDEIAGAEPSNAETLS
jgi:nucleoid-associated protein YgaU